MFEYLLPDILKFW